MFDESAVVVQIPAVIKARTDGDRRLLEICASREVVDSEGDVILQSALLNSADYFVKNGVIDVDHISEIGDRLGVSHPSDYIIGNPLEVKDLGGGATGVIAEIQRGRPKADEVWGSLTATPPVPWQASIYGFPESGGLLDARVAKAEDMRGATRFLVKSLLWKSLALTRSPINTSVDAARVLTAKSLLAVMKARPQFGGNGVLSSQLLDVPLILSPKTEADLRDHFFNHVATGGCPHAGNSGSLATSGFVAHLEKCCGDTREEALVKARALTGMLKSDNRVSFYPFSKSPLGGTGATHTTVPPSMTRQVRTMTKIDTDATLFERFAAFLKGQAHGGAPGSDKIEGIKIVEDIFNEPNGEHSVPSRSEIVTGPAEASSGGGAVRMVARYSDPSAQTGLTALYDRVDGLMREFQKAQAEATKRIEKSERALGALITLVGEIGKAQEAAATAKAAEVQVIAEDTFLGKADQKLVKARKALRKADMEEDEKEREERKSDLNAILDTLKSAIRLLVKAEEENEDEEKVEKALAATKSLQAKVQKALGEIAKAEDDEKKEKEEEAAKAAASAASATAAAPAAKSETSEEEEKKDDTAKAETAKAQAEQVEKALSGLGLEVTTIKGMMETLMAASRQAPVLAPGPTFAKSEGAQVTSIQARIDAARDSGILSDGEGIVAQSLMQRQALAAAGRLSPEQVARDIASAPSAVREIFQAAA